MGSSLACLTQKNHKHPYYLQNKNKIKPDSSSNNQNTNDTDGNTEGTYQDRFILQCCIIPGKNRMKKNVKQLQYPYNCIGIILMQYNRMVSHDQISYRKKQFKKMGTGFLVGPSIVLTAAHCLPADYQQQDQIFFGIMNKQNQKWSKFYQLKHAGIGYKKANYKIGEVDSKRNDYAILFLQRQIKLQKYINIGYNYCQKDEADLFGFTKTNLVQSIQYNQSIIQSGMRGKIKQIDGYNLLYDIDTAEGQSGSPILVQFVEGMFYAIGIHLGRRQIDDYNTGLWMQKQVVDNIHKWIQNQKLESNNRMVAVQLKKYYPFRRYLSDQPSLNQQQLIVNLLQNINKPNDDIQNQNQLFQREKQHSYDLYKKSKYQESLLCLEKTLIKYFKHQQKLAQIYHLMGLNYHALAQFNPAKILYFKSLKHYQIIKSKYAQQQVIKLYNNIGALHLDHNRKIQAQQYFQKAKEYIKQSSSATCNHKVASLLNDGIMFWKQLNTKQALQHFKKALIVLQTDRKDGLNQQMAMIYKNMALCYYDLKNYNQWLRCSYEGLIIMLILKLNFQNNYKSWSKDFIIKIVQFIKNTQANDSLLLQIVQIVDSLFYLTAQQQRKQVLSLVQKKITQMTS